MPFRCAHRAELDQKLADAIQDVYRLSAEAQSAQSGSVTRDALLNLLQKGRQDQRHAEQAFLDHVKEHDCPECSFPARGR